MKQSDREMVFKEHEIREEMINDLKGDAYDKRALWAKSLAEYVNIAMGGLTKVGENDR